jgi:hypothetical protein
LVKVLAQVVKLGELWFGAETVKGASEGGGGGRITMRASGRSFYRARGTKITLRLDSIL